MAERSPSACTANSASALLFFQWRIGFIRRRLRFGALGLPREDRDLFIAANNGYLLAFDNWRVVDSPPVRFRRAAGMQPLPEPLSGGSIETLRSFLNVKTNTD